MTFKITLVKNNRNQAMMETKDRYHVLLNGEFFDELYFNIRGYLGYLPTPEGGKLSCGEQSLAAYKKDIAQLNREGKSLKV